MDVSVQAQEIKLIEEMSEELNIKMVLVSNDLAVVGRINNKVIVLKAGEIVEQGDTASVILNPQHEYTQKLRAAATAVSL